MSLKQWAENGWLKPHKTTPQEIRNLLAIVDRDLQDVAGGISADSRLSLAYNFLEFLKVHGRELSGES